MAPTTFSPSATVLLARSTAHGFVRRASLAVTADAQKVTLGVIAAYVVVIAILWNVWQVLLPFKILTVAFHEFSHAFAAKLTGGKVDSISLDLKQGGVTHYRGGSQAITLPAGYIGSSLIGALLTFCGFNSVASKIASFVVGAAFLFLIWWGRRDWLTVVTILATVGLLVGCWFIAEAEALRYVILFIGVMSSLYSAWDINDDLIQRKVNESDATKFAVAYGGSSQCWGVIWVIISLIFMIGGILAGIAAFPQTLAEQKQDSEGFISTSGSYSPLQHSPMAALILTVLATTCTITC